MSYLLQSNAAALCEISFNNSDTPAMTRSGKRHSAGPSADRTPIGNARMPPSSRTNIFVNIEIKTMSGSSSNSRRNRRETRSHPTMRPISARIKLTLRICVFSRPRERMNGFARAPAPFHVRALSHINRRRVFQSAKYALQVALRSGRSHPGKYSARPSCSCGAEHNCRAPWRCAPGRPFPSTYKL